ncbi:hypothetical protein GCM10011591_05470 [Nocardia camponoti]|uniref:Uncharacterized protein n=1 Tax=Nocardia camponoti TaxID=1616106 RepID=A0A917Q991_9NOCA|nr:hypothetical protein GCM10011591_05470 [Nocardia camponoti]
MQGASLFEANVVIDADAGELGEFLTAQPGNAAPTAIARQPQFLRLQAGSPRSQKFA